MCYLQQSAAPSGFSAKFYVKLADWDLVFIRKSVFSYVKGNLTSTGCSLIEKMQLNIYETNTYPLKHLELKLALNFKVRSLFFRQ